MAFSLSPHALRSPSGERAGEKPTTTGAGALHSSARSSPGRSVTRGSHTHGACALRCARDGGQEARCLESLPLARPTVRRMMVLCAWPAPLVSPPRPLLSGRSEAGGTSRKIRTHHGKTRAPDSAFNQSRTAGVVFGGDGRGLVARPRAVSPPGLLHSPLVERGRKPWKNELSEGR